MLFKFHEIEKEVVMFKKTIIAATLLGLASTGSASTLNVGATAADVPVVKSTQGILSSVGVAAASFAVTTEAAITTGSTIQVTYSAAVANPSLVSATVASCAGTPTVAYAGTTGSGTVLNYTVANAVAQLPIGCELTFGGGTPAAFAKADVVAGAITATASWTVVGSGVDPVTTPKTILSVAAADQYGLTVTGVLNAEVNVEATPERSAYTVGATDVLTLTYVDNGGGATDVSSIITLTGDFGWADDPQTAAFDVGVRRGQTPIAVTGWALGDGTTAPLPTATTLSLYKATPSNADTAVVTFTPIVTAGTGTPADLTDDHTAVALPNTAFTVSQVVAFTDEVTPVAGAGNQSTAAASAGAWTLNGASTKVFSVPFGSEVESHSIFVSNSGTSTGAISGSMVYNGNAAVPFTLGNVEPGANKYLNVIAALTAIGEKPAFGRADITFTVNAPAADITFTAGYTTAAGRANLYMQEQANMSTLSSAAATSAATAATQATTAATQSTTAATQATTAATQSTTAATQSTQAVLDVDLTCDNLTLIAGEMNDMTGFTLADITLAGC